jgi:hypothetical protein
VTAANGNIGDGIRNAENLVEHVSGRGRAQCPVRPLTLDTLDAPLPENSVTRSMDRFFCSRGAS